MTRYSGFRQYMEQERGFRGWLVFFYVTTCLAAVLRGYWLFVAGTTLRAAVDHGSAVLVVLVIAQTAIHAALLIATVYGLRLFALGDARTPTFWATFLLASIGSFILLDAVVALETTVVDATPFGATFWPLLRDGGLRGTALQLIWVLYWMRSVRVHLTFGCNAFKRAADSPAQTLSPVT